MGLFVLGIGMLDTLKFAEPLLLGWGWWRSPFSCRAHALDELIWRLRLTETALQQRAFREKSDAATHRG
jgi:hypothetical protein